MATDAIAPESVTVVLPAGIKAALDDLSQRENVLRDEVVGEALREHLFLRQFRTLRQRFTSAARAQGIETDQDVFDRVS